MTLLGIVLIPLPGPGFPLVIVGAIALLAAAVLRMAPRQRPRRTFWIAAMSQRSRCGSYWPPRASRPRYLRLKAM